MEIASPDPIQTTVYQTIYKQEDDIINVYIMIMIIVNCTILQVLKMHWYLTL